jgi:wobble nucleotide-excising tRNase
VINKFLLFRNVGQFDSVNSAYNILLHRLVLLYAENGRGKTTLAAILRSLGSGDPLPISERRRLAAAHPPHVALECIGGPPDAVFMNNAWNRRVPNIVVFDDHFIDENVYSGLAVEADHRQHPHELILGAQGVTLNSNLQELIQRVDTRTRELRVKTDAIPASERGELGIDDFCALPERADIDAAIQATERGLAAASERDAIRNAPLFDPLILPAFDAEAIAGLLARDLPSLDAAALAEVQDHFASIGEDGEAWVAAGMNRLSAAPEGAAQPCPFCAQDLHASPIIDHYRVYFSAAYTDLKQAISSAVAALTRLHAGESPAAFERAVRVCGERRQFWSKFAELPEVSLDTAEIARVWRAAREAVLKALQAKQSAPLERMSLSAEAGAAAAAFEHRRAEITALSQQLHEANKEIEFVKEKAAAGNAAALAADLARLKAIKARYTPEMVAKCADYLAEKAAKTAAEQERNQARTCLEEYRQTIFPAYETAINLYLQRFNAGFRLARVTAVNTARGSSCTYNVVINDQQVAVAGSPAAGAPSFRNTLSAGDRNTLALAFFFASLDQHPALADKIVIIDDPITSLDEHRSLTTVQEIRHLAERTAQVIVLSHTKSFLCRIWQGADHDERTALELARDGAGSTIRTWDINEDSVTEHDRRHALLRQYLAGSTPNNRQVAQSLRPVIEAFLRVACPEHFLPGTLLGPFRNLCQQRVGTALEILDQDDTRELGQLVEYANRFHHDTNPAWETEIINDAELLGFVRRTLRFAKR